MIALDTNIVSEVLRPRPDARVLDFLGGIDDRHVFVPTPFSPNSVTVSKSSSHPGASASLWRWSTRSSLNTIVTAC
ncbi:hypothetical protein [Prosthecodimorpha staleyi]|uniref:hypothetical protein n=1 Tax=Prosthecodimorpha staleyi TaxID=2840188 RepID=UPI0036F2CBA4